MPHQTTVHILLATYNGEKYLQEQLQSIAKQTHRRWTLTVSDDGSKDRTVDIVRQFSDIVQQPVRLLQGPKTGSPTHNFFNLIQQASIDNNQDLYAFCDQDDIWLEKKLECAVKWHNQLEHTPARLYCGATQYVDKNLKIIGLSPKIKRSPSFSNALVQNIASGNTMIMSHAVIMAQRKVKPNHSIWHDWTTYLVTTALGGVVFYDEIPFLLYRQHENNVIGSNHGLMANMKRLKPLLQGRFKQWNDANMAAFLDLEELPTKSAVEIHNKFKCLRAMQNPWQKFHLWKNTDIRRQSRISNFMLGMSLLFDLA